MIDIGDLYKAWMIAKENEEAWVSERRDLEDKIISHLSLDSTDDTTKTIKHGDLVVKITTRHDRKVDRAKLMEVAAANGLDDHLSSLFRWKPEINKIAWDDVGDNVRAILSDAITTKAGRPSFKITRKD